jgi:inner membrane transporter RhtA
LFGRVGPGGAVTLRLVLAAVVLLGAVAVPARRRGWGPRLAEEAGPAGRPAGNVTADWAVAVAFGVVLAAMNLSFYESIDRIPLGVAVTVEFSGPLALALAGSRRWADGFWGVCAGLGVALLATGLGRHLDPAGVGLALLAGVFWVCYILLSKETGRRFASVRGLAWAMAAGGLAVLPFGVATGGTRLLDPSVVGTGAAVAVLSSVIPYSLELLALRRVTSRAFGVMMSLDPALATAAGYLVLGQRLSFREWVALAFVVVANLGNSLTAERDVALTLENG